jgi:micrococcal nuclease
MGLDMMHYSGFKVAAREGWRFSLKSPASAGNYQPSSQEVLSLRTATVESVWSLWQQGILKLISHPATMNRLLALTAAIALLLQAPVLAQTRTPGVVISTGDGDTLRVQVNGKVTTVRLACVDAPESTQAGGKEAAIRLSQFLPKNQNVELRVVEIDRYGRSIAEVFKNGASVNLQMVQEGRAAVYRQYLSACAGNQDRYLQAEAKAKQRKLAFWSQANPIMPWDFRAGQRSPANPTPVARPAAPAPTAQTSNCSPAYPGVCIPPAPPDLDCGEVSYRNFTVVAPDPHGFDRDGDGVGCEK